MYGRMCVIIYVLRTGFESGPGGSLRETRNKNNRKGWKQERRGDEMGRIGNKMRGEKRSGEDKRDEGSRGEGRGGEERRG